MTTPLASAHHLHDQAAGEVQPRPATGANPRLTARLTGILFLLTILGGIFAQAFVSNRLISFSDASLTASNILANRALFEAGFTVYLIEMACAVASVALFYRLVRVVNTDIALAAAFLALTGNVIKTLSRVFFIAPLFVLTGTKALNAFNPDQLRALALLLLKINDRGAGLALAFFGVSGVLNGYLLFRSGFFPRILGILAMIGSAGWLRFFIPSLRFPSFMFIVVFALFSAALQIFWLIVYGVDEVAWKKASGDQR
ncbi:MAG: DUF4386 domain-containing protein [Acidobacteria bacterium]|nr:DUF4386 domain-containing protein [Acidobacteriota bacterium]